MTIGEKIKNARINAHLTQKQLGEKLGVSYVVVSQYENGKRNPKFTTLQKIADALEIDVGTLLDDKYIAEAQKTLGDFKTAVAFFATAMKEDDLKKMVEAYLETNQLMPAAESLYNELLEQAQTKLLKNIDFSDEESLKNTENILKIFSSLNNDGQQKTIDYAIDLSGNKDYQKKQEIPEENRTLLV